MLHDLGRKTTYRKSLPHGKETPRIIDAFLFPFIFCKIKICVIRLAVLAYLPSWLFPLPVKLSIQIISQVLFISFHFFLLMSTFDRQIHTPSLNHPSYILAASFEWSHFTNLETLRIPPKANNLCCIILVNILPKFEMWMNSDFFIFLGP